MTTQSFIGICGIQNSTDLANIVRRAPSVLDGTNHFLMVGIKKVTDKITVQNTFDAVRPFVHCDFTAQEPFEHTVERTMDQSKDFVRGLQLNVLPWMEVDFAPLWCKLKLQYPDLTLMLQAHRIIIEQYTPIQIASRLRGLPVKYILFDASQSRGIAYNPNFMRPYIDAVYQERPEIGVVIAGGLSGPRMDSLFAPLVSEYPALSCDAFGQLQNPGTQLLSWPQIDAYLSAWKGIIARGRSTTYNRPMLR